MLRPIEIIPDVLGFLSVSSATVVAYVPVERLASNYISDSICICQTLITHLLCLIEFCALKSACLSA